VIRWRGAGGLGCRAQLHKRFAFVCGGGSPLHPLSIRLWRLDGPTAEGGGHLALYRFEMQIVARNGGRIGRSAVACAAYRAGAKLKDERSGEIKDYSEREDVEGTFIIAPEGAPEWVYDRQRLWNEVEARETRINSRLAREIDLAIPRELDAQQRRELVLEYVQTQFVQRGMIADVAIHSPHSIVKNPHAHIMLTTREITPEGFGKKVRDWDRLELLQDAREAWQNTANRHLERAGHEVRIDHRSIAVQRKEALDRGDYDKAIELFRPPGHHKGPTATHIERKARGSSEKIQELKKQRTAELATYAEIREKAKEHLAIARANGPQIPIVVKEEIRDMERNLSKLVAERRAVELDLHFLEATNTPKKQVAGHEPQTRQPVQKPSEAQKSNVPTDPLERARVDRPYFRELVQKTDREWDQAKTAQLDGARKLIEERLKPELDRRTEITKRHNSLLWVRNETEQDSKKARNIFRRSAMREEVTRLDSVLGKLREDHNEVNSRIAAARSPYEVERVQGNLAAKAHPQLAQLRQTLRHLATEWNQRDQQLQHHRGLDGPELEIGFQHAHRDWDKGIER
jgi:hypothetical protein